MLPIDTCAMYNGQGLIYMMCKVSRLLNGVLPVLLALGIVYFVWGVVQYFIGDNEEAKTKGKERIIFGIIGLVVILAVWGLVTIVANSFGLGASTAPTPDQINDLLPQQQQP